MGILAPLGFIFGLLSFAFFFYFLYLDIASFMFLLLDYIVGYFSLIYAYSYFFSFCSLFFIVAFIFPHRIRVWIGFW